MNQKTMMKLLIITLLSINVQLFGQNRLLLKDGSLITFETVDFPRLSSDQNAKIKYTTLDKQTREIDHKDFNGIHYPKTGVIYYWRRSNTQSAKLLLPKIQEGQIKIFEELNVSGGGAGARELLWYLEKGQEYEMIKGRGLLANNTKHLETIKSFVSDLPSAKQIVEDPEYKNRWDDIRRVVKKYNVEKFDLDRQLNSGNRDSISKEDLVNVTFYVEKKIDPDSYLRINDSTKLKISAIAPSPVKLPQFKIIKVCLVSGAKTYCDLIMPIPPVQNYFEIELEEDFISLNRKEEKFAKRDISDNYLRYKNH
jgi:hypothetical protein